MLEYGYKNTWTPPDLPEEEIYKDIKQLGRLDGTNGFLWVFKSDKYIDSYYISFNGKPHGRDLWRFTIHEGYIWDQEKEEAFAELIVKDPGCIYKPEELDRVYEIYSSRHPEWHLKRYRTHRGRMLDHIYNCIKQNTAKEMLYKAGLDELAVGADNIDELNLLATRPSDLYDGISMRTLRSLNCEDGAELLSEHHYREYIKDLQKAYPDIFRNKLNNAQCRYIKYLIDGEVTVRECGRLYKARESKLFMIWSKTGYEIFLCTEQKEEVRRKIAAIDPIYADYIRDCGENTDIKMLEYYLLLHREESDKQIRQNIRKSPEDWQEKGTEYVVRYPQTINDFLREAIYMRNCLKTYVEAFLDNETTILFIRKADDVNKPFITMEVFEGRFTQASHRFNEGCTLEEHAWISEYCRRHGIEETNY